MQLYHKIFLLFGGFILIPMTSLVVTKTYPVNSLIPVVIPIFLLYSMIGFWVGRKFPEETTIHLASLLLGGSWFWLFFSGLGWGFNEFIILMFVTSNTLIPLIIFCGKHSIKKNAKLLG